MRTSLHHACLTCSLAEIAAPQKNNQLVLVHDFLVEHAKFPFPRPDEGQTVNTTDISSLEVGLLEREWKAGRAVRDDTLVQKLCQTLKDILGDTPSTAEAESYLPADFLSQLQVHKSGRDNKQWDRNPSESQVSI